MFVPSFSKTYKTHKHLHNPKTRLWTNKQRQEDVKHRQSQAELTRAAPFLPYGYKVRLRADQSISLSSKLQKRDPPYQKSPPNLERTKA